MKARTHIPAMLEVDAVTSKKAVVSRWLRRWRQRLASWRRPLALTLPADAQARGGAQAVAELTQAFEAWAAAHEGAAVELSLSSHMLLMLADGDLTDAQVLRERAADRWAHYLDLPAGDFDTDWLVQTSLDQARAPVAVACALPRTLAEGLQAVARRHGLALRALQPWWAGALASAWRDLPPSSDGHAPRLWTWREGSWQTQARVSAESGKWVLRSLAFVAADPSDGTELADLVFEASDVAGAGESNQAAEAAEVAQALSRRPRAWRAGWFDRADRTDWAESLNFSGPRVRTSFWSWALLALGAIAVVHAMDLSSQLVASEQATEAELSRLQAHARATPSAAPSSSLDQAGAVSTKAQAPVLQPEGWRSAAQLAAWLGHPWAAALDHADATAHERGISLTGFQVDLAAWGARPGQPLAWRLQAAVPDDAAALQWVQELGPQAELQRRDALLQPVPSERGTLSWRVNVSSGGGQP